MISIDSNIVVYNFAIVQYNTMELFYVMDGMLVVILLFERFFL